jgi:hypothetical protein
MTNHKKCLPGFLSSLILLLIASGCSQQDSKADEAFIKSLKSQPIGKTGFSIALPPGYEITSSQGPDYEVYYFSPIDTATPPSFSGGMYLGNAPSTFEPANDSCKIEPRTGKILDRKESWMVYNCNNVYSIQVIVECKGEKDWNDYIHAFGGGISLTEINKVFAIYATLGRQTSI